MSHSSDRHAARIRVTGIVQGVGFRPFVFNLAEECGVFGWVLNDSEGVLIHAEGSPEEIEHFIRILPSRAPAMSVVEKVSVTDTDPEGFEAFSIRASEHLLGAVTLISPDIATCPECASELLDPEDRRYRYPFINCTNCGPRFTIIDETPYDRPNTSMEPFRMCERCASEYGDPKDRRFHAQPDACFACGPRLYLCEGPSLSAGGRFAADVREKDATGLLGEDGFIAAERSRSDAIIVRTVELLRSGRIVAIKGLGGYHLVCDATSEEALGRLRERKHRWGKPLAIMVPSLEDAKHYCEVSPKEAEILTGTVRPIVLLRRHRIDIASAPLDTQPLADSVAGDLRELGVMLPYTPLQHLLMASFSGPLVMTSGNLTDEPIETQDDSARERLGTIADAFLFNDREIRSRYDDSVVRVVAEKTMVIRRARGLAPNPLRIPEALRVKGCSVLATGPEQKVTFTLTRGGYAFTSQHIGDLETASTMKSWEDTVSLYERLFRVKPTVIACDLHPEYLSSKWARTHAAEADLPLVEVQHHHAHIAGVCAEHDLDSTVTGIAFDGTGYGPDNTIWGGEGLIANRATYSRFAHLDRFALPGGAAAVRRPARVAIGLLKQHGLFDHPGARAFLGRLAEGELPLISQMIDRSINTPMTSSMGRLFDAVSSLVGIADDSLYEGSAAIELEAHLDEGETGSYDFALHEDATPFVIDHRPVIVSVLDDLAAGVSAAAISTRFHNAVVELICDLARLGCDITGNRYVALAGGVFMNRFVTERAVALLEEDSYQVLLPKELPVNDGAISYGQAIVALATACGESRGQAIGCGLKCI